MRPRPHKLKIEIEKRLGKGGGYLYKINRQGSGCSMTLAHLVHVISKTVETSAPALVPSGTIEEVAAHIIAELSNV